MRAFIRLIASSVVAALLTVGMVTTATAAEIPEPALKSDTRIIAGDAPTLLPEGSVVESFGEGSTVVAVPNAAASAPGEVSPMLSVGVGWTLYIYLNRTDQGALATGGAAGLAILICAIPAVGTAACAGVAAMLAMGAYYISQNGFCKSRLELAAGRGAKCVA